MLLGFAAVDGVDGEEDDVASAAGDIKHGGMLGYIVAVFYQAGDEEILGVGVTKDDAGAIGRRNDARIIVGLLVSGIGNSQSSRLGSSGGF